jgi:DNA-binding CsgD family transcriptional regulator
VFYQSSDRTGCPLIPANALGWVDNDRVDKVRGFDLDGCSEERPPDMRRRLPTEQMRRRDAAVDRLLRAGYSYRQIAARLDCSLGAVQKAVGRLREAKRASRLET